MNLFRTTIADARPWGLALVALLAACGGEAGDARDPEQLPTEDSREELAGTDYGDLDPADVGLHVTWASNLISYDPPPDTEPSRLTEVTTTSHEGFDRVTFSFEPRIPGYRLAFTEGAGGGCDGTEAGMEAPAQLAIEFERATATGGGTSLISERDRTLDYPTLSRAVQTCDEDGKVRWLLAASSEAEYRLLEAFAYTLLVVDLRSRPGSE